MCLYRSLQWFTGRRRTATLRCLYDDAMNRANYLCRLLRRAASSVEIVELAS